MTDGLCPHCLCFTCINKLYRQNQCRTCPEHLEILDCLDYENKNECPYYEPQCDNKDCVQCPHGDGYLK